MKNKKEVITTTGEPIIPIPEDEEHVDFHINNVHDLKIAVNRITRESGKIKVPIFFAYIIPESGKFVYNAILPEEVGAEQAYGKFNGFLRQCIGFNPDECIVKIEK